MAETFPYKLYGGATREDAISGLAPAFREALLRMYAAAPPEVQAELGLNSAYRSPERQQELWNASDKTGRMVARPGKSRHNKGDAVDLYGFGLGGGKTNLVSQATRDWVNQNAGAHGFEFPMSYEPWHMQMKAEQMAAAGYSPEQIKAALLSTISGTESPGYDIMYGGEKFTDFSKHPNRRMPILDQQGNVTGYSTAAGKYQFINSTWEDLAKKHGYKDFSAANQDAAAWQLAAETMGGEAELMAALQSNDPGRLNAVAAKLGSQWEGIKKLGPNKFSDIYAKNLGSVQGGAGQPGSAAPDSKGPAAPPAPASKADKKKSMWEIAGDALSDIGKAPPLKLAGAPPGIAEPARVDAPAVAPLVPQDPNRRQMLAQLMARLNSGSLVG